MKKNLHNWVFLLCLVLFFAMFDTAIAYFGEEIWPYAYNDYEATRVAHPEAVWDRVFYGSSDIVSAYREELSEAGYVEFGMDYAVMTDLWKLLDQGHIQVGSDLVIAMNLFALYDDFATNPAYIWHRGPLEPYTYFHRDKLQRIAEDGLDLLMGKEVRSFRKVLYYGALSQEELAKKLVTFEEKYFSLPLEDFQENIAIMDQIADWCDSHDVRLRILWMPFHPDVEKPERMLELMEIINGWCAERSIAVGDFTDKMSRECFHDITHLNDEIGAAKFTEVIDPWLLG